MGNVEIDVLAERLNRLIDVTSCDASLHAFPIVPYLNYEVFDA